MPVILKVLSLACFVLALAWCVIDDNPDFIDVLAAISGGLALWVGSELVPE